MLSLPLKRLNAMFIHLLREELYLFTYIASKVKHRYLKDTLERFHPEHLNEINQVNLIQRRMILQSLLASLSGKSLSTVKRHYWVYVRDLRIPTEFDHPLPRVIIFTGTRKSP